LLQSSTHPGPAINSEVIVTCAVTGAGDNHQKSAHVPVTPRQIAEAVREAALAGAAIAHVHVRDPATGAGSRRVELYREVLDRIRQFGVDIIVNLTAGMGGDIVFGAQNPLDLGPETDLVGALERLAHVEELLPEICTLDCGSYNVGRENLVYISTSAQITTAAARLKVLGVKPELEIFELGHLRFVLELIRADAFVPPVLIQLCLGVPFSAPATTEAMLAMKSMLPSAPAIVWSSFGLGALQMPMAAQAVILGGNLRVGLEDNLYLRRGVLATNGQLVNSAVALLDLLGARALTPAETRLRLGLRPRET
jgi:uncharacterized protein (DUF849 family)